ncbi:MAG: hypothetical protein U1F42_06600 [Candidatus Competibacteraceae bacterium]
MTAMLDWRSAGEKVIGMGMDAGALGQSARRRSKRNSSLVRRRIWPRSRIDRRERTYPSPISASVDVLQANAGCRIVLLASGDPLLGGVSHMLLRAICCQNIRRVPSQRVQHSGGVRAAKRPCGSRRNWSVCTTTASLRAGPQGNRLWRCAH